MLLAAGADPNVREAAYGNTPLMLAALRCATTLTFAAPLARMRVARPT
jgi:ankyrin repeat protein